MKTYILKKDYTVPGMVIPAGSGGKEKTNGVRVIYQFCNKNGCKFFSEREVSNNPDWFDLKEEINE